MIESYDVGSLPPKIKHKEMLELLSAYEKGVNSGLPQSLEEIIVGAFLDRL